MAISMTDRAATRIIALRATASDAHGLRIKVIGGGCSGLQYKMDLDVEKPGDKIFEHNGAKLIVDRKSFLYLNGTELDYRDEVMASQFVIQNPNAKRTCGCGESFSV